jgi:lipoprotein-anchoring transpeptidase ErfK/SrfK
MRTLAVIAVALAALVSTPAVASAIEPTGPTATSAWRARLVVKTPAMNTPDGARVVQVLQPYAPWAGGRAALLVLDTAVVPGKGRWLKVLLARRPNGTVGWIRADHTRLARTRWRIEISRSKRLLTLFHAGRPFRSTRVVVGSPSTPTPTGIMAVVERVRQSNPDGFLGPWALHLTALSNVLDDYGGGPGRVAIHGRSGASLRDPLGSARSHGCVRIANSFVSMLARVAREGTPVRIRA